MSYRKERLRTRVTLIKNLICVCLILLILLWMAKPFYPTVPSQEQMAFVTKLYDRDTMILLYLKRKPYIIPFLYSKQVEIGFALPDDLSFESWHRNTFQKIGAEDIKVSHESVTAVARTCEGTTVRIRAVLSSTKRAVHCYLVFQ